MSKRPSSDLVLDSVPNKKSKKQKKKKKQKTIFADGTAKACVEYLSTLEQKSVINKINRMQTIYKKKIKENENLQDSSDSDSEHEDTQEINEEKATKHQHFKSNLVNKTQNIKLDINQLAKDGAVVTGNSIEFSDFNKMEDMNSYIKKVNALIENEKKKPKKQTANPDKEVDPKGSNVNKLKIVCGPSQADFDSKFHDIGLQYAKQHMTYYEKKYRESIDENAKKHVTEEISSKHVAIMLQKPILPSTPRCENAAKCFMKDLEKGFVGKAYMSPLQLEYFLKHKGNPPEQIKGLCYICTIAYIFKLYNDNNSANHLPKKIYLPFCHKVGQPGEYNKNSMIQQNNGYTNGITQPIRSFCVSDYYRVEEKVTLPDGSTHMIPVFHEKEQVFFVNSSRDLGIAQVRPFVHHVYNIQKLTTEFLLREILSQSKTYTRSLITNILDKYKSINFISNERKLWCTGEQESKEVLKICKPFPKEKSFNQAQIVEILKKHKKVVKDPSRLVWTLFNNTLTIKYIVRTSLLDLTFGVVHTGQIRRRNICIDDQSKEKESQNTQHALSYESLSKGFHINIPILRGNGRKKKINEQYTLFSGHPFDFIFTDNMSLTESNIEPLATFFGYQTINEYNKIVYEYPTFCIHNRHTNENHPTLHSKAKESYKKYHALHIRINVAQALCEIICNEFGLGYTDYIKIYDYLDDPHKKTIKDNVFLKLVKSYNSRKVTSRDKQLLRKLSLFIKGQMQLVETFRSLLGDDPLQYIIPDEKFKIVPQQKVQLSEKIEVDEWRTMEELIPIKSPDYFTKEDEFYSSYQITTYYRDTPYQEINKFFKKAGIDHSQCFNTFEHTLSLIRKTNTDKLSKLWQLTGGFKYWNPTPLCSEEMFNQPNLLEYSIFITLLWRIHFSYEQIEKLKENVLRKEKFINETKIPDKMMNNNEFINKYNNIKESIKEHWEVIYYLRCFALTHLNLAQYICNYRCTLDSELDKPFQNSDSVCAYQKYYPDDIGCPHEGQLLDLSKYYTYVDFITRNNNKNTSDFFYLTCKLMPKCCLSRRYKQKQIEACKNNEAYCNWVKQCLYIGFLGMYKSCKEWLSFEKSLVIHNWYGRISCLQDILKKDVREELRNEFIDFQEKNADIVMTALRENMFFQIQFNIPYLQTVREYFPEWDNFQQVLNQKMDMVRYTYNKTGKMSQINDMVQSIFADVRFVYRKNPTEFNKYILDMFNTINGELANSKKRKTKNTFIEKKDYIIKNLYQNENSIIGLLTSGKKVELPPKLNDDYIILIQEFVKRQDPTKDIDIADLKYIKMSDAGISIINKVYKFFINHDQNRNVIDIMKRMNILDYEIAFCFFNELRLHNSIVVIPTDYDTKLKQEQGVRAKYNLSKTEPIPDASKAIVFTNCCHSLKTFLGLRYYGNEKIYYDSNTGYDLCYGKNSKSNAKKKESSSSNCKKKEKMIKNRYTKQCSKTHVIPINGIGSLVQFTTITEKQSAETYSICHNVKCGALTTFSLSKFGPNGFTCGECNKDEIDDFNRKVCDGGCNTIKRDKKWVSVIMVDDETGKLIEYNYCGSCSKKAVLSKMSRASLIQYGTEIQSITKKESEAIAGSKITTHKELDNELWNQHPGKKQLLTNYQSI